MKLSFVAFITRYKTYIIVTLLVIVCLLLLLKFPAKDNIITETFLKDDEVEYDDSEIIDKNDSLGKYGLCALENIIINEDAKVRRTPNVARYNTLYELKFGTKIYTKGIDMENKNHSFVDPSLVERENRNGFVAIYAVEPITLSEKPVGYVAAEDIILKSEFKNFKPQPKRIEIDPLVLSAIQSNLTFNGVNYKLIEDNKRFNNSLAYGDYNNDGNRDFAIILDTEDNADSILLIYFMNEDKSGYHQVFSTFATPFLKINTVPKHTTIVFSSESTAFPFDGIQITSSDPKPFYYFYTANTNSFTVVRDSK